MKASVGKEQCMLSCNSSYTHARACVSCPANTFFYLTRSKAMHIKQQLILDILFCFIIQCREMCSLHSKPRYIPYTTSLDKHTHIHTYTRHTLTHTLYFCLSVSLSASQVYAFSLWPHPVDHLLQSSSLPILHACHFISSTPLPPLPLSLSSAVQFKEDLQA